MMMLVKRCFELALGGDAGVDVICCESPFIISVTKDKSTKIKEIYIYIFLVKEIFFQKIKNYINFLNLLLSGRSSMPSLMEVFSKKSL